MKLWVKNVYVSDNTEAKSGGDSVCSHIETKHKYTILISHRDPAYFRMGESKKVCLLLKKFRRVDADMKLFTAV